MTEDELILSLCKEKALVKGGSDEEVIQQFRTLYQSHSELIRKAAQGDESALRQLRWVCGLKVLPQNIGEEMQAKEKVGMIEKVIDDLDYVLANLAVILSNAEDPDLVTGRAHSLADVIKNLKEFVNGDLADALGVSLEKDEKKGKA